MIRHLKNYCSETTLHGFKYFADEKTHRSEKIFWVFSLLASLISCVCLITKLATDVRKMPIVTVISNEPVSIGDIPFPAITFCQEMKIQESDGAYRMLESFYGENVEKHVNEKGFATLKISKFSEKLSFCFDLVLNFCTQWI